MYVFHCATLVDVSALKCCILVFAAANQPGTSWDSSSTVTLDSVNCTSQQLAHLPTLALQKEGKNSRRSSMSGAPPTRTRSAGRCIGTRNPLEQLAYQTLSFPRRCN